MKHLKYFENANIEQEISDIQPGQTWKSSDNNKFVTIIKILNNQIYIQEHNNESGMLGIRYVNKDDFLNSFKLVQDTYDDVKLNFNSYVYNDKDNSIIACYFITNEDDKHIEVMNVSEYPNKTIRGGDGAVAFSIGIEYTKLPKSQISKKEDENRKGFFYIKMPYWLYKKNLKTLKIMRINTDLKRLHLKSNDLITMVDELQDPNLFEYFKNCYFDYKTSNRLIKYYRDTAIRMAKDKKAYLDSIDKI